MLMNSAYFIFQKSVKTPTYRNYYLHITNIIFHRCSITLIANAHHMDLLKKIGMGLLILITMLLIIGLFLPSEVNVQRSRLMNAEPEAIFQQVNNLKNWPGWMPWSRKDPDMRIEWGKKTEGEGASYTWFSKKPEVGDGSLVIRSSVPYESVETEMDFRENGKARGTFRLEQVPQGTFVTWSMHSEMGSNPMFRLIGPFMDRMIGPDFEEGLHALDSLTDKAQRITDLD